MAFYKNVVILLAIMICGIRVQAQSLDSLEQVLQTQKLTPGEQIKTYDDLSWGYLSINFDKSFDYAQKGLAIAEKEKNTAMVGTFYRNLGIAYYMNGSNDTARLYLDQALKYALKTQNESFEATIYGAIGNVYHVEGQTEKALEYYQKSLKLSEKHNNKSRISLLLGNIGAMYLHIDNHLQAESYYLRAEKIYTEINDLFGLAAIKNGLANIYIEKKEFQKALDYALSAVDICHSLGMTAEESTALQMAAFVYKDGFEDYPRALEYARKSLELSEKTGYIRDIVASLSVLATTQFKMGQYTECEENALRGLSLDSTHIVKKTLLFSVLRASIMLEKKEQALDYATQINDLTFHLNNDEFKQKLFDMELKYETDKKELQINALKEQKLFITWLSIALGIIFLLAMAFFIAKHRLAVNKRKLAEQQIKQLEQEQQLVATQAVLDGETAERTRLARDLHDGLGSMLSVVKLNLNDMKNGVSIESEDVIRFDRVVGLLDESIHELRRVAHNMMPDSLSRYGLRASLNDFCNSIPGAVFSHYGSDGRLDPKLEVMIYRTVHELVNNALKHAGATEIIVQMIQESDRISITVQDDGCGFDSAAPTSGTGLNNIRNRVGSYNGRMDVYSEPGKGTEVNVEFKL